MIISTIKTKYINYYTFLDKYKILANVKFILYFNTNISLYYLYRCLFYFLER